MTLKIAIYGNFPEIPNIKKDVTFIDVTGGGKWRPIGMNFAELNFLYPLWAKTGDKTQFMIAVAAPYIVTRKF